MAQCRGCGRFLTIAETGAPCPNCGCVDRNVTSFEQAHAVEGAVAEAAKVLAWKHYELEEGAHPYFPHHPTKPWLRSREGHRSNCSKSTQIHQSQGSSLCSSALRLRAASPTASVIVEVSPSEFQKLQSNELKLPEGWSIGEEFPRPMDVGGR